jgi:hypothetical protein
MNSSGRARARVTIRISLRGVVSAAAVGAEGMAHLLTDIRMLL